MSAHTAGPWEVFCYGPGGSKIVAGDTLVAELGGHLRGDHEAAETLVADGRLIAAAPDLLIQAQRLLLWIEGGDVSPCDRLAADLREVRAAIAKARGSK